MTEILLRFVFLFLFLLGLFVVGNDLMIIAYWDAEATALALLLRFNELLGMSSWGAYLLWLTPMLVGTIGLIGSCPTLIGRYRR